LLDIQAELGAKNRRIGLGSGNWASANKKFDSAALLEPRDKNFATALATELRQLNWLQQFEPQDKNCDSARYGIATA
jgi:hypothetical protein